MKIKRLLNVRPSSSTREVEKFLAKVFLIDKTDAKDNLIKMMNENKTLQNNEKEEKGRLNCLNYLSFVKFYF